MLPIQFFNSGVSLPLRDRTKLKLFLMKLFKREGRALSELNYIFCSDEDLIQINRRFLSHDYYTDIVTFDLSGPQSPLTGEIHISIDRVRDNAITLQQTVKRELHRVIFHGALHLCGYKDKTATEASEMRVAEEKYLDLYFT